MLYQPEVWRISLDTNQGHEQRDPKIEEAHNMLLDAAFRAINIWNLGTSYSEGYGFVAISAG